LKAAHEEGLAHPHADFASPDAGHVDYGRFALCGFGLFNVKTSLDAKGNIARDCALAAPPFRVTSRARAADGAEWGKRVEFSDDDGRVKSLTISDRALSAAIGERGPTADGRKIIGDLADAGFRVVREMDFLEYLRGVPVARRETTLKRTGWHSIGERSVFALPDTVVGATDEEAFALDDTARGAPYAQRGTLGEWQEHVARPAGAHRLGVLAMSAALTGPLLHLTEAESGGVHFVGNSSTGKTSLLCSAASVWGKGEMKGGFVGAWRTTSNALETSAASSSDTLLVLDELGQVDPKDLVGAVYMLANEKGKARMRSDATARLSHEWRVAVLSSGETTITARIETVRGQKAPAGVEVRILEFDADAGAGRGAFDHGDGKSASDELRHAARRFYGVAGAAFVGAIVESGAAAIGECARARVDGFIVRYLPGDATGQPMRAAQRFGLIAAAGELAIELGILPWAPGTAEAAAAWALGRWIERRGGVGSGEDTQALAQVRELLERYGDTKFDEVEETAKSMEEAVRHAGEAEIACDRGQPEPAEPEEELEAGRNRARFERFGLRKGEGAERRWLVFSEVWRKVFCAGFNSRDVARSLIERGVLTPTGSRGGGKSRNLTTNWRVNGRSVYGYELNAEALGDGGG
jgi:uncharacterized protein (DUF927 family)